jgi:FMN phosphatase YigB (HAD superfamily)
MHVGDELKADREEPMAAGIKSILIDRTGKLQGPGIITSLSSL